VVSSNTALGPSSRSRCPDPSTNASISRMSSPKLVERRSAVAAVQIGVIIWM
jgi:hypothetical protein